MPLPWLMVFLLIFFSFYSVMFYFSSISFFSSSKILVVESGRLDFSW